MAAAFLGQSDGNPATHSLAASSVSARGYLHRSQHMCCHARLPVDAGSRSVAWRTGASAVRPPGRRRLDLFWIRALCRMCPPLNIRAAAEAGVVAMVAHTGSPHPFFYSRQRRHRDRRATRLVAAGCRHGAGGLVAFPVPPIRAAPRGPRAPGRAVAAQAQHMRTPPGRRARSPARACRAPRPRAAFRPVRLALCCRAALALSNCVPARVCGAMMVTN